MKKKLALILAMIMVVTSLAACGNASKEESSDGGKKSETKKEETIVGEWEASVSFMDVFADMMTESLGMEGMEDYFDFDKLPDLMLFCEFTDDGECTVGLDEDNAEEFVDEMIEVMMDGMIVMIEDMVEAEGMTIEDYYEAMGMTEEEFLESAREEIDPDALKDTLAETTAEAIYEVKGDKIYFGLDGADEVSEDEYWVFELDGDELKITEAASEDEEEAVLTEEILPITFERK